MSGFNADLGTSRDEYAAQGKSNRFIAAQEAGRMTVGHAAKLVSKRLGVKVLATDLEPLCTEFHHAGRFGGNKARRVYFMSQEEVEDVTIEQIEKAKTAQWGWVLGFYKSGRRWIPNIAEVGLIPASRIHRLGEKFSPLSREEAEQAKAAIGKALPPYCSDWRQAK